MPSYHPAVVEPRWQKFWLDNRTFAARPVGEGPKFYVLDMFPYPSGAGLHVGHPEGYTATDILARWKRMQGFNVLHPMGWDAFGLPAEQYAVQTNTHPAVTTAKNVANFRRQIRMLGFSYDWDREVDTTDPDYYRWTQWIFLRLHDTWYDAEAGRGRPIAELPIPDDVDADEYRDQHRLAYLAEVAVNWCAELGTVLANEEIKDGVSERGGHPVVRLPMRQWMLRITAYAERLIEDLDGLDWPESIRKMQLEWIGKSVGCEVDFRVVLPDDQGADVEAWFDARKADGLPESPAADVIRVFTTRPDTLYGATYMVLAPEHPLVDRIATDEQREAVDKYRAAAAGKSDLDRTDLAKEKTGVFTGSYAVNPANQELVPIWIADYVLIGYGTGAIMAVPAHDERDFEFATRFGLEIRPVVADPADTPALMRRAYDWLGRWDRRLAAAGADEDAGYVKVAMVLNCRFDVESFQEDRRASQRDPMWEEVELFDDQAENRGLAVKYLHDDFEEILEQYVEPEEDTVVYVLSHDPDQDDGDDLLEAGDDFEEDDFAEEEDDEPLAAFTGHGIAYDSGTLTGLKTADAKKRIADELAAAGLGRAATNYKLRDWLFSRQRYWGEPFPILIDENGRPHPLAEDELPVTLPPMDDFKPTGTAEAPLSKAKDWLAVTKDGKTYTRETNTMPQWAGSCWYYLRYLDPKNTERLVDPEVEKYWMPVDLYVGGAEHAVLHLLYARFWHKVLCDLGVVSTPEPFARLVNQGMILGEMEFVGYRDADAWIDPPADKDAVETVKLDEDAVEKRGSDWVHLESGKRVDARAFKMSKSRGNVVNPDDVVEQYGADALRLYEMFMGPLEQVKPWQMKGLEGIWRFLNRSWRLVVDEDAEELRPSPAVTDADADRDTLRALHQTIRGVTEDLEALRFNTAISKLMELCNRLTKLDARPKAVLETFTLLLSPLAPHVGEQMWSVLGHDGTLAYEPWPTHDEALCAADEVEVAIQVNNKVKAKIKVAPDTSDADLIAAARADDAVQAASAGKSIVKSFVVDSRRGKLVNLIVKG